MDKKDLESKCQIDPKHVPNCLIFHTPIDKKAYAEFLSHNCGMKVDYDHTKGLVIGCRYTLAENELGGEITVKCKCGLEKDITDYSSW